MNHIASFQNQSTGRFASLDSEGSVYYVEAHTIVDDAERTRFDPINYMSPREALEDAREHAQNWVNARPDNIEWLVYLMRHAKTGPLMQAFIIQALSTFAAKVAQSDPDKLGNAMVSGAAWHACAMELQRALNERLGG